MQANTKPRTAAPQRSAHIRQVIIGLAMKPGGTNRTTLRQRFNSVDRKTAVVIVDELTTSGLLEATATHTSTNPGVNYRATQQACEEHARNAKLLPPKRANKPPPPVAAAKLHGQLSAASTGATLYHPAQTSLPCSIKRHGMQPPPLPGALIRGAAVPAPQPIKPRKTGDPIVTVCPGWTHNHRFQVAPGAVVHGEFSALGVGRYLDGAA